MLSETDYKNPHYCSVFDKIIDVDLCYDSLMCLGKYFKISSSKELSQIQDIETAREKCKNCPYSDLE